MLLTDQIKWGHVPDASAATGSTDFLRADGTWATPAGGSFRLRRATDLHVDSG